MSISLLSTLSAVYPITATLLFVVMCYASSHTFHVIQREIKRVNQSALVTDRDLKLLLLTYKRIHILACGTVDAINDCFGTSLLLSTAFFSVSIINSSFYLFGYNKNMTPADIAFPLVNVLHLTIMCFSAHHVRNKVH